MLLDGKLQETIDTEKLRLVRSDPNFIKAIEDFAKDPVKDIDLTEEERSQAKISLYSLSEIYPDFLSIFKALKKKTIQIPIASLCGSVERLEDKYWHGFRPKVETDEFKELVKKIEDGELDTKNAPINVHAIPFKEKFEGFVQNGSEIVAAHLKANKTSVWADVTFYKQIKQKKKK